MSKNNNFSKHRLFDIQDRLAEMGIDVSTDHNSNGQVVITFTNVYYWSDGEYHDSPENISQPTCANCQESLER